MGGGNFNTASFTTHVMPTSGGGIDLAGAVSNNSSYSFSPMISRWTTPAASGGERHHEPGITTLTVSSGQTLTFTNTTSLAGANLVVSAASKLFFPAATSYTGAIRSDTTLSATGAGSKIPT